jgi:hypothetical protein
VGFFIFIFILFEKKRKVTVQSHRACSLFGYGQKNINIDPTESIFSANYFIVASDGEGEKQQPCHLPFSYHVLVTCHRLVGVKNCHGNYLDSDPLVKV